MKVSKHTGLLLATPTVQYFDVCCEKLCTIHTCFSLSEAVFQSPANLLLISAKSMDEEKSFKAGIRNVL